MKVLIIDDSRLLRVASQRALVRAGHDAIAAGDGQLGLNMAREQRPDVILLDMMLPTISGPDVLRALKKDPLTNSIPVVVLSALSSRNKERLVSEGAAGFIEKSDSLLANGSVELIRAVEETAQDGNRSRVV